MPQHARSAITARIRELLEYLISQDVIHFYAGGANGFDMWFSCVVLELRELYPQITLTIALPDKNYTAKWAAEDLLCMDQICTEADEILTVPNQGLREPALVRNDFMIKRGAHCVAYLRNNLLTRRGGTSYTVRHAAEKGCQIYSLAKKEDDLA